MLAWYVVTAAASVKLCDRIANGTNDVMSTVFCFVCHR